jgi:hypothetical protein
VSPKSSDGQRITPEKLIGIDAYVFDCTGLNRISIVSSKEPGTFNLDPTNEEAPDR